MGKGYGSYPVPMGNMWVLKPQKCAVTIDRTRGFIFPNQYQNALLNLIASLNCTHGKNTIYESKPETNDPDLPSQQKALDWYWALLQL